MAIFDINGDAVASVYDVNGNALQIAYDKDGNIVYSAGELLTVMSFNVQQFTGINSNQTFLSDLYDAYTPNIIGIQELGYSNAIPSAGQSFLSPYTYYQIGGQYNKTALFSKIALSNPSFIYFDGESGYSQPYGYQKAYFSFNGRTICWVDAHLRTSSEETKKVAEAGEIFNAVQNEPYFIITGDFNTVCKSVRDTEYTTIMKQFIDAGYHSANCSEQHGFIDTWTSGSTASGTWYPTDHIITSENIFITNVIADISKIDIASQTGQSIDHLPLIAELIVV